MSTESPPPDFTQPIVLWEGERYEMVFLPIPAGRFRMGSRGEYSAEEPRHWVEITRPFWMAETPVTQAQYRYLAGLCLDELAKIDGNKGAEPSDFKGKENHPVESVNWNESQVIARALSRSGALPACLPLDYSARLPTEAQWEYACRAGTSTEYHSGDGEAALDRAGWYDGNADGSTHPVKAKEKNDFDLYDMHGNGVRMSGIRRLTGNEERPVRTRLLKVMETRIGSSGAAHGTTRPGIAAPPSASGAIQAAATGTRASGFACPPVRWKTSQPRGRRPRKKRSAAGSGREGRPTWRPEEAKRIVPKEVVFREFPPRSGSIFF